ncbi:hypothetical protein CLV31_12436 [Algoriphagus aquaeductus]|uniref:Uncharacterized protein n=1 Tax=Algoriphagus aquaeductus TaxID=475299 RepID=A0A326RK69_9BACT|nr:hypothetical protein CLV31_12436 [Algoriphagus aquaeductus]
MVYSRYYFKFNNYSESKKTIDFNVNIYNYSYT